VTSYEPKHLQAEFIDQRITMSIEVKVPVLPESVADATVAAWHKKPGDTVFRDDKLVDLETDKVVLEVPAPVDGVIKEILRDAGETVLSEEVLAIIEEGKVERPVEATAAPTEAPAKDTGPVVAESAPADIS